MQRSDRKSFARCCLSALLALLAVIVSDRLIGHFFPTAAEEDGLVLPARFKRVLRTSEFDSTVVVNALGFRDREFQAERNHAYRIVAVGDSATFGWGVDIEDTWVKQLETRLRQRGVRVEVANLGQGGSYPKYYADIIEKALPLLKPDLVLIGVLQGDDLAQGEADVDIPGRRSSETTPTVSFRSRFIEIIRVILPNLAARLAAVIQPTQRQTWQRQVTALISTDEGKATFARLEPTIRQLYQEGNLNPGLFAGAIRSPHHMVTTLHLDAPVTRALIAEMSEHLSRIRTLAADHDAEVIVLSIPAREYMNRFDLDQTRRLGFHASDEMLNSTAPDDAIRMAAETAGLPFASVSPQFRQIAQDRRLFFSYDGHFNIDGNSVLADLFLPLVESHVRYAQSQVAK